MRLQRPVTLYSLRQKFWPLVVLGDNNQQPGDSGVWGEGRAYLILKAQNCWLMICQTISSDAIVGGFVGVVEWSGRGSW